MKGEEFFRIVPQNEQHTSVCIINFFKRLACDAA